MDNGHDPEPPGHDEHYEQRPRERKPDAEDTPGKRANETQRRKNDRDDPHPTSLQITAARPAPIAGLRGRPKIEKPSV